MVLYIIPARCRNTLREERYLQRSIKKVERSLDVVTFLRTQKRLKVIEKVLFNSKQLTLTKMTKWNYLSDSTSTDSDKEYPDINRLVGYRISGPCDNRIVKAIQRVDSTKKQDMVDVT